MSDPISPRIAASRTPRSAARSQELPGSRSRARSARPATSSWSGMERQDSFQSGQSPMMSPREESANRSRNISKWRKAALLKSFQGQVDTKEREFITRVKEDDRYHALDHCTHGCADHRVELTRIIWDIVGPEQEELIKLQERNKFLEERSVKQQRQFLMELTAVKSKLARGSNGGYELDDSTCMYEPLMHLDADHRELVIEISQLEVQKIIDGTGGGSSSWLFQQLQSVNKMSEELCALKKEAVELKKQAADYPLMKDLNASLKKEIEDLTRAKNELKEWLDAGKVREEKLQAELREAKAKPVDDGVATKELRQLRVQMQQEEEKFKLVTKQLDETQSQLDVERKRFAELQKKFEDVSAQLKEASAKFADADAAAADLAAAQEKEIERLQSELHAAKDGNNALEEAEKKVKKLKAEVENLRKQLAETNTKPDNSFEVHELRRQSKESEEKLADANSTLQKEVKARQKAEQLAADLQKDLDEMSRKYQASELALAEMGERLQRMAEALEKAGIKKEVVQEAISTAGLKDLMVQGPDKNRVFERLYRDAAERVARLEQKRAELQKLRSEAMIRDHNFALPFNHYPSTNFAAAKGPMVTLQSPNEMKQIRMPEQLNDFIAESLEELADPLIMGPSLGGMLVKPPGTEKAIYRPMQKESGGRQAQYSEPKSLQATNSEPRSFPPSESKALPTVWVSLGHGPYPEPKALSKHVPQDMATLRPYAASDSSSHMLAVSASQSFSVDQAGSTGHPSYPEPKVSKRMPQAATTCPPDASDFGEVPLRTVNILEQNSVNVNDGSSISNSSPFMGGSLTAQAGAQWPNDGKQKFRNRTPERPRAASDFADVPLRGVSIERTGDSTSSENRKDHFSGGKIGRADVQGKKGPSDIQARTVPSSGHTFAVHFSEGDGRGGRAPVPLKSHGAKDTQPSVAPEGKAVKTVETTAAQPSVSLESSRELVECSPTTSAAASNYAFLAQHGQQKITKSFSATHQPQWHGSAEKRGWSRSPSPGREPQALSSLVDRQREVPLHSQMLSQQDIALAALEPSHSAAALTGTALQDCEAVIGKMSATVGPGSFQKAQTGPGSAATGTTVARTQIPVGGRNPRANAMASSSIETPTSSEAAPSWYHFCRGEQSSEEEYYRRRYEQQESLKFVETTAQPTLTQSTSLPSLEQSPTRGAATGKGAGRGRGRGQRFQQLWSVDI